MRNARRHRPARGDNVFRNGNHASCVVPPRVLVHHSLARRETDRAAQLALRCDASDEAGELERVTRPEKPAGALRLDDLAHLPEPGRDDR